MGARSPPFVVIGLLVILGVLGFNYWNLTYEYDAIVKEISDLQDHLRIALLKKESADKQSDALEKRFREAEQQLGKVKITANQSQRDLADVKRNLDIKNSELLTIKSQLETCQTANVKLNSNQETIADLQSKIDQLEEDKNKLSQLNSLVVGEKADLSLKVEELEKNVAILNGMRNEFFIFVRFLCQNVVYNDLSPLSATAAIQPAGQLEPLKRGKVQVHLIGMNGMEPHFGGPLMPNLPDEEPREMQNSLFNNGVLPLPDAVPKQARIRSDKMGINFLVFLIQIRTYLSVATRLNTTGPKNITENGAQKSKEFNNESNVLQAPNLKPSSTNKDLNETKNNTKNANQVEKVADREDGELIVAGMAGISDFEIKDKPLDEGNGIDDETKPMRSELNATTEDELKSIKLHMPKLDNAQLAKPVNLSEHAANNDWRENAV
uniref:Uncharacterized protein n=1 Tax=Strigamia maritima TaxID=126957 RepID=T1IWS6_STRMM